jgi:hypothetical protein
MPPAMPQIGKVVAEDIAHLLCREALGQLVPEPRCGFTRVHWFGHHLTHDSGRRIDIGIGPSVV